MVNFQAIGKSFPAPLTKPVYFSDANDAKIKDRIIRPESRHNALREVATLRQQQLTESEIQSIKSGQLTLEETAKSKGYLDKDRVLKNLHPKRFDILEAIISFVEPGQRIKVSSYYESTDGVKSCNVRQGVVTDYYVGNNDIGFFGLTYNPDPEITYGRGNFPFDPSRRAFNPDEVEIQKEGDKKLEIVYKRTVGFQANHVFIGGDLNSSYFVVIEKID